MDDQLSGEETQQYSYIRFEGARVEHGNVSIADLREILDGIEKATKYFIGTEYPLVAKNNYQVEVRLVPGSLTAIIVGLAMLGGGAFITAYGKKAGETLAQNDIGDKTSADIVNSAVRKVKSTIRIAKHLGGMGGRQSFPEAKIISKEVIQLPNDEGKKIQVSQLELDTYAKAPKDIFGKLTAPVDAGTTMYVCEPGEIPYSKSAVRVSSSEKIYFGSTETDTSAVDLPQLQHGERVVLTGELCRANTNTGTLGFKYEGHTLTSSLLQMEISEIKDSLFDKEVEIVATVNRTPSKLDADDELRRPKLVIRSVKIIGDIKRENRPKNQELDI